MIKQIGIFTAICLMGLHSLPVNAQEMTPEEKYNPQRQDRVNGAIRPRLKMPQTIVVCRAKQCAPTRLSMAKEYIYNTLLHMFDSNAREKALVCQGNANTHACTEEFVTVPIKVGVTPAYLYIDDVKIADVSISQQNTMALNLLLNWGVSYNGQTPVCRPSKNLLYVKNVDNVIMEDNGYTCKMTTIGNTTVSTMFAIDYIDMDYNYIGGYYSIGLSGPAYGGGSGYMILRLPKDISVEAKDFEVKPLEPKIEESVVETIEEIPVEEPAEAKAEPKAEAQPKAEKKYVLRKIEKEVVTEPQIQPQQVHLSAPEGLENYPTQGQYLCDSNTGHCVALKVMENNASVQPQAAPVAQPMAVPADNMYVEPFQYAATARKSYTPAISNTMPSDNELVADMLAQSYTPASVQAVTPMPQAGQTMLPSSQVPVYGQYFYDASSGQYVPLYGQYQFDPATGQYVPLSMLPASSVLPTPYAPAQQEVREPQAPNVSTIIKYNHPARDYEQAKAQEAAEVKRQRKEKEKEAQAVDFGGVKVFPIPSSNADRTTQAPTLKNSLSEYNRTESRRYE